MNQAIEGKPGRYWHVLKDGAYPVRRLPALLQAARRPARAVFRTRASRPADGAHDLRPLIGLLHRSDREKTAQSLPAGHAGAVIRHCGLQLNLQVLSELK